MLWGQELDKNSDLQHPKNVKTGEMTGTSSTKMQIKMKRTLDIVVANVNADCIFTCMDLVTAHGVSYGTMHNILHDELGLVKKLARWVPKLLSEEQKKEQIRICTATP